jgi:hypothetical protein
MHKLIDLLEQASAVLQPFTQDVRPGALAYDGTRYAPSAPQSPDAYALAWWSSFQAIIALLGGFETLTESQRDYLRRTICGGMGSFGDFSLDEKRWGASATKANHQLAQIRASFYEALSHLEPVA